MQEDRTKFVLVLYCGGTIGMKAKNGVYSPEPHFLEKELRRQPIFHDPHFPTTCLLHDKLHCDNLLVLPPTNDGQRIVYAVEEYDPLLDSSCMSYDDYVKLAKDISENYKFFDGFVILHGTDTMAFTASALSFMIENLGKPIIFTGSQIPIFELRSVCVCGCACVCVCHHSSLRPPPPPSPSSSSSVNWTDVFRSVGMKKFQVSTRMCPNVGVLRLFPNITIETIRSFLRPPMQGVVLQTYGQGNGPDNRLDILKAIKEATDRGVIVVNCTQCSKGIVNPIYAAGKAFFEAGVISGSDMTVEAALMKLSYLLGKEELSLAQRRKLIGLNLRGELSEVLNEEDEKVHVSLIENLADVLRLGTGHERHQLEIELFPYLLCLAAHEGSVNTLEKLKKAGAYFNMADYDGRTPLHIASCNGDVDVVRYLLEEGAPVHQRDRFNYSPLDNALQFRQKDIVPLLIKTGAHITVMTPKHINNFISLVIMILNDDLQTVEMWCDAGADVNMGGFEGRTPLHVAVNFNLIDKVIRWFIGLLVG
ncbi:hypothetical protein HELRODRAFT_82547 [Helobdella robusta]|uniref:asparaginase n=1 Tax=Helobdella robusta TaxID=6412 RepID=T1G4T6_HELRO|nr:hypothetical protein HELRODRAFT_82547 [Helobdella robusta]ESO00899.1 hypothetical protein HELRODRAFT_82547 [Helobdella robusta]